MQISTCRNTHELLTFRERHNTYSNHAAEIESILIEILKKNLTDTNKQNYISIIGNRYNSEIKKILI